MLGKTPMISSGSTTHFRRRDYVKITIFGLAVSALWGSLHSVILPLRLLDFVAESQKNTYLGLLTLTGLLLAMAYQAIIPDLAPEERRGLASGVKTLLEVVGGIGLVYIITFLGNRFLGDGAWISLVLALLVALMLGGMLVTIITVKERPGIPGPRQPFFPTLLKSYRIDLHRSPGFITFLVSRLLFIMALTTLQSFAPSFFRDT